MSLLDYRLPSGFAIAATRRFARLPYGAFVRELNASGYPLHLPQATWARLSNSHGRTLIDKSYVLHGIPYKVSVVGSCQN